MSFLTAAPEFVTAAAGDLADIGSALGAANAEWVGRFDKRVAEWVGCFD